MQKQTTQTTAATRPATRHPPLKKIDDGVVAAVVIVMGWRKGVRLCMAHGSFCAFRAG